MALEELAGMSVGGMSKVGCGCQFHEVREQGMRGIYKVVHSEVRGPAGGNNIF